MRNGNSFLNFSSDDNMEMQVDDLVFAPKISEGEIRFEGIVGQGAFGTVKKGQWRGRDVAVKLFDLKQDGQNLEKELIALSRLDHPNIIKLFGASTGSPIFLVMEYAEGGSLYNLLHNKPDVSYSQDRAISWSLQCAKGVNYLHGQKPRPMVHRDLKSPNLLLFNGGTVIKICDFGTARDVKTYMTHSRGTFAWMAPEVFKSNYYTETCDVFSWAIILWEILAREKPFADLVTPFAVMWAVGQGIRPPLLPTCPPAIESLMTRCWQEDHLSRPSMAEVETEMELFAGSMPDSPIGTVETASIRQRPTSLEKRPLTNRESNMSKFARWKSQDTVLDNESENELSRKPEMARSSSFNVLDDHDDLPTSARWAENAIYMTGDAQAVADFQNGAGFLSRLNPLLTPIEPDCSNVKSMQIYHDHRKAASEYVRIDTKLQMFQELQEELEDVLDQREHIYENLNWINLIKERDELLALKGRLKAKNDALQRHRRQQEAQENGDWVLIDSK
ncbi:Mitogen-activated protein kinase kinase kinase 7 [Halotydeus destructor]|nr:Mitogen-activated protein kinase kinase kinase 7 [Halotydeus destructor]